MISETGAIAITGARLKAGAMAMIEAIRITPQLRTLSDHELVVVHAYVLGMLMGGAEIAVTSLTKAGGLGAVIDDGIRDIQTILHPEGR